MIFSHNKGEYTLDINGLYEHYVAVRHAQGLSEDETELLTSLSCLLGHGNIKLTKQKPRLDLNDDLKNFLIKKQQDISKTLSQNSKTVKIQDRSLAQYLIEATLFCFECFKDNSQMRKKDIDDYLGFKSRTMRVQQSIYKEKLFKVTTPEYKEYTALKEEIKNKFCL